MKKLILLFAAVLFIQHLQAQLKLDLTHVPASGPPPAIAIKKPVIYKMSNGLTVLILEDHRLPKVTATFLTNTGPVDERDKAGAMTLMAAMLNEGATTMSKAEFNEAVDMTGSTLVFNPTGATVSALTRYFSEVLGLMGKAITEPAFDLQTFEDVKIQQVAQLQSQTRNTALLADKITNALAYGKTHPKGEFATTQTMQKITLQDVKDAYHNYIKPSGSYLVIIGDISPGPACKLATAVFGSWTATPSILPRLPLVNNPVTIEIDVVNVPSSVQSQINIVNLINVKLSDPDYFPLLLANRILGGVPEGRLTSDIRNKQAFSYEPYSTINVGLFQGMFKASALVRNAKTDTAVIVMMDEIKRLRTEKVSASELSNAKAVYNGSFALGMENLSRTSGYATDILINKLPADFYQTYLQRVEAVTADDVLRVAKKYINYMRIVITGNQQQFIDGLQKMGYPVRFFDIDGNAVK